MIKKVGIINYGAGNLKSITQAVQRLGLKTYVIQKGKLDSFDLLILPGVGNFGPAMENIRVHGLYEEIVNFYNKCRPILGICLGIQLLFEKSEEAKSVSGLGLLEGKVKRFKVRNLPIPHMCWNIVEFKNNDRILLKGLQKKEYFYFVHSYYPVPEDKSIIFATTVYEYKFCSMIVKDNLVATQFHLEKSGVKGLKLLSNIICYFNRI